MSCHAYMIFAVMKIGLRPKKAGTASSMMLWVLTKLILDSGSEVESTLHRPGRGDGSLILGTERGDVETPSKSGCFKHRPPKNTKVKHKTQAKTLKKSGRHFPPFVRNLRKNSIF